MQRGRYGNLTATAMQRSQFISPGLLRQQQVRRTYPNISSDTIIHNSLNEDTNNVHTSVRKTTQVPEADDSEHGGASDTLFDSTVKEKNPNMQVSHVLQMLAKIQMMKKQQMNSMIGIGKQRSPNPPSVEITVGLLIKIGCLLEGAEMTTGLLISIWHVLQGVAMIKGPLTKKTCMPKGDRFHRVLHIQCRMMNYRIMTTWKLKKYKSSSDLQIHQMVAKQYRNGKAVEETNDKFENANPDIEIDVYKVEIMEHARDLWNNWRGDLNRQFVKPARNMQQAIKNCPKGIKKPDWEWLVKEHSYSKDFIDKSKRNSKNRSNLKILHHSGSKPYRQIIWDNGGKENNPPTLDKLFSLTHMKDGTFVDSKTSTKHAEIEVERLLNPSLSNMELMDKCFESNRRDHAVGYGGGIRARDLRNPSVTKAKLIEKLTQSKQEKKELQEDNRALHEENWMITNSVSRMEEEWAELKHNMSASLAHE